MKRSHRMWIVLAVFALVAAACGGGDDSSADTTAATTSAPGTTAAPDTPATTAPDQPTATTAPPATSTPDEPSSGSGGGSTAPNMAVVTVGDKTYEFDVDQSVVGRCDPDFFGAFWVIASAADGSGANLEMFFVPDGDTNHNETSRIRVGVENTDGRDWRADEDGGQGAVEGESRVESVEWNGNTISGTASFVDLEVGDGATAEGTFEATCP